MYLIRYTNKKEIFMTESELKIKETRSLLKAVAKEIETKDDEEKFFEELAKLEEIENE